MRRLITTLFILIVLAGVAWFGYQRFSEMQASAAEEPTYEIVAVERGSINSTVSATGSIEPESQVSLSFRSAGRASQVLVSVGQSVAEGQLLAQLDTSDIELALEQANVSLQISQAQLKSWKHRLVKMIWLRPRLR
ncbi:MAG: biotin/lipoyl-binding protein [Caldilineaceae bacterium]